MLHHQVWFQGSELASALKQCLGPEIEQNFQQAKDCRGTSDDGTDKESYRRCKRRETKTVQIKTDVDWKDFMQREICTIGSQELF